jgi:hypothetical protein
LYPIDFFLGEYSKGVLLDLMVFSYSSLKSKNYLIFIHYIYVFFVLLTYLALGLVFQMLSYRNQFTIKIPHIPENLTEDALKNIFEEKFGKDSGIPHNIFNLKSQRSFHSFEFVKL